MRRTCIACHERFSLLYTHFAIPIDNDLCILYITHRSLAIRRSERCGCHLLEELQVTQPTLSHHKKVLCRTPSC
ncbi:MAG: ArsR family transcriptional regulator [Lachnospiraceae bacterium]